MTRVYVLERQATRPDRAAKDREPAARATSLSDSPHRQRARGGRVVAAGGQAQPGALQPPAPGRNVRGGAAEVEGGGWAGAAPLEPQNHAGGRGNPAEPQLPAFLSDSGTWRGGGGRRQRWGRAGARTRGLSQAGPAGPGAHGPAQPAGPWQVCQEGEQQRGTGQRNGGSRFVCCSGLSSW